MRLLIVCSLIAAAASIIATQTLTVFVIQPIGAIPEVRTLIMSRMSTMNFIDSADAWCDRQMGGVSLLCRIGVLSRIGNSGAIYARLPYSEWLYFHSTGGKTFGG